MKFAADAGIPRTVLPETGQRVCPGSVFIPTRDGDCICGHPLGAHVWRATNGAFRRVTDAEQAAYLSGEDDGVTP